MEHTWSQSLQFPYVDVPKPWNVLIQGWRRAMNARTSFWLESWVDWWSPSSVSLWKHGSRHHPWASITMLVELKQIFARFPREGLPSIDKCTPWVIEAGRFSVLGWTNSSVYHVPCLDSDIHRSERNWPFPPQPWPVPYSRTISWQRWSWSSWRRSV